MYQEEGMLGSRTPISPEDLFLETQFSLTTTNDPIPGPGFDVPVYQRTRYVNDQQEGLDVQIRHRTRTQKGWTSITAEDKIRVTKDRGKVFQLIIDSPLPFSKESVSLGLELNGQPIDAAAGGLKVVKISSVSSRTDNTRTRYSAEVSIKISALCDRLRVIASVASDPTHVLTGRTVEFMTHNNGKVSNQRDEMEIQPKKLQPVVPQQSPPPNPNEHCAVHNNNNNKRSHAQHTQQHQQQHYQQQQPHQVYPQDSLILNNNSHQTFRGDQRQHIQGYTSPPASGVKGGGSGGKKKGNTISNHGNNDNMNILYNKLMKDAPESPPHPQVGDCSSPEYNIGGGEEPPLSQMKKRKYNNNNVTQSPVRLESPPHPTAGYTPQQPYLGNYPVQQHQQHPQQHQQQYYNNNYPQQQHAQQPYVQPPPQLYAGTPVYNNNNKFNGGFSGDSSYSHTDSSSTTSSARNSVTLNGDVTWGNASFSPQSTPEEEFEMQEMAAGAHSGQGSEEEEYGGSFNTKVGIAPKGGSAAQVINGDLSVRGAVRARAYMQYSDIRLKTDVEDIVDAIDLISKLDGKRYRWKPEAFSEKSLSVPSDDADVIKISSDSEDEFSDDDIESSVGSAIPLLDGKTSVFKNFGFSAKTDLDEDHTKKGHKVIGLIAQEVQRVLPEVVTEDEDGYLAVAYAEIVPVLISAFNEHMSKYNQEQMLLKKRFDQFEVQLETITEEKEDLADKETLAQLAQEMKELIPETPYSRLVKKLSSIRRRDRIIQRNCCCLLALMFCFVIGLSIALAIIGPVTFQNVYNVVSPITDNNNNNNNNNNVIPGGTRAFELLSISSTSARLGGLRTDATDTIDSLTFSVLLSTGPPNDPLSISTVHTVTPSTNRRQERSVDNLYVRDDSDTTLNFTVSLASFFQYEEENGQAGYQQGESMTNLLTPTTAKWTALSSRTLKGTNNNGEVTIICVSSTANSILTLQMCVADQSCVYNGVAYSANGLHISGWTNLTLYSDDRYGMTLYYGSKSKSTVTYDVVTPSLIYQEDKNSVSVGQLTWQHSFSTNTTIVPSWKSGPSLMTFSFAGSTAASASPPSFYFDAAVQYV